MPNICGTLVHVESGWEIVIATLPKSLQPSTGPCAEVYQSCMATLTLALQTCSKVRVSMASVHPRCIQFYFIGAPGYGDLETTGIGPTKDVEDAMSIESLQENCLESNLELLKSLGEAPDSEHVFHQTVEEAKTGRMTMPIPATECDMSKIRLSPRFAVEQGIKAYVCVVHFVCALVYL